MCTYKPDINELYCEFDNCNYPVTVSLYVEYISLISHGICTVECSSDIGKASPFAPFNNVNPFLNCSFRIRMYLNVFF